MNNPMRQGLGPCGLCARNIPMMTEISSVMIGKRSYVCCKSCPRKDDCLRKLGVEVPEVSDHPLVVSHPAVFAAASYKEITEPTAVELSPSMPVKEQTGRRRTKKRTDESDETE